MFLVAVASLVWSTGSRLCRPQELGECAPWLWRVGSVAAAPGLESRGSIVTWNLPGSEIKFVSHALAGRFFTTEPPGKSCGQVFVQMKVFISLG